MKNIYFITLHQVLFHQKCSINLEVDKVSSTPFFLVTLSIPS